MGRAVQNASNLMPCGLRFTRYRRDLKVENAVQQRRFTHIRPADDGCISDLEAFLILSHVMHFELQNYSDCSLKEGVSYTGEPFAILTSAFVANKMAAGLSGQLNRL